MKPISQMEPWIGLEERQAIVQYLDSGGWLTEFHKTREFEERIAEFVGSRYSVVVSNGTVSLAVALMALGVGEGDEVIVPDFTMLASATSVMLAGARPVFVDVERHSYCLDLDLAEAAITAKTRALMVVSMNGRSPDMTRAVELCTRRGLYLIEDAAQSLGSRFSDKQLGTWGHIGSFSFSAPKIITTGQGGALVTDDPVLDAKMRKIKDFGRRRAGEDFYETRGFNFKFTDLQAVIGLEQMKKLAWRVRRKKEMYKTYQTELAGADEVTFLPTDLEHVTPWFVDILVSDPAGLREHLKGCQIGSRPVYPALHSQPAFGLVGRFPNSEFVARHGLWLPSSSFLSDEDIRFVCQAIRTYFGRN
ncbi:MAG: DegT/DnrJ/EryC1/StrS family aminotransferase [Acidobacteria bacterium]|nr:MAG: DegT/DnrJ/EryC1/StrS family aminotransferase [Acidobacteriota bacterium]